MSTNEMTSVSYESLETKISAYNAELAKDAPNASTLAGIEKQAKEACAEIAKELIKQKLNELLVYTNPMLELARTLEISVPGIKLERDKDTGAVSAMVRADKTKTLPADAMTACLKKYSAEKDGFVQNGVFAYGSSWIYKAEKFAALMTQRVAKALEVNQEAQKSIKETYALGDKAKTEGGAVKDPTSNKQMVSMLQEIIDTFCVVTNEKGGNALHCTGKDLAFIEAKFTGRDSKNALAIKVAAGKNICQYILQVAHALVTGRPYEVTGWKQEAGSEAVAYKPFRDPLPESPKRNKIEEQAA